MKLDPPDWISEEAKECFREIVAAMGGAVIPSDASLIADFAEAQADVIRLSKVVQFEGDTTITKTGSCYVNPVLTVLMSRRKDLDRLRDKLNLTPRARGAKVSTKATSGLKSAMAK